jgi:hypothetical protein
MEAPVWHRWEDNVKMDLKEIGCDHVGWIYLAQERDNGRLL